MGETEETNRGPWLPNVLPWSVHGVPDRIRLTWLTLWVLVAAIQLAGLAFVLFDAFRVNPALERVGIARDFDDDSRPVVKPLRGDIVAAGVSPGDRIASVAGRRFAPDASELSLARAIMAAPGDTVEIGFRKPDGRRVSVRASRSSRAPIVTAPNPIPVNVRMGVRLLFTLLCSLALMGSSLVLLQRRPRDPEAVLLGVGFLGIAACVDPPLLMWMSTGVDWVINVVTGLWWTAMVIALAAFPDGRFTPSWLRWSLVVAPILGFILMFDQIGEIVSLVLGVTVPLMLLAGQMVRYRRLEAGLKRQQIKWAALGFSAGFVLVGAALTMTLASYDDWSPAVRGAWLLCTVCLFNLGFAIMPLGLLISLIRYRLWDVDRIISRSVGYTVLTGGIGLLWALLSDVAKQIVAMLLGQDHALLALALGAVVAAGVFVPTQQMVLRWSKRRFNPASVDLDRLPERLQIWRERCDASEVATRSLDVAMRALHASAGAVFARTPEGRTLLARRSAAGDGTAALPFLASDRGSGGEYIVHLEDEDGLAGWLVLVPCDDGSRFPKSELGALTAAAGPLAKALRIAVPASRRETAVLGLLDEVQQRLAKLEQSNVRPA